MRRLLVTLFFVPALLGAQEAPEEPPVLVAAAWCAVHDGEAREGEVGCDVGVGAPFMRLGRFSLVGAVGPGSVAAGLAFTAYRGSMEGEGRRVVVALAVGVTAPYDERGIDAGRMAPALGCTFGFGGGER